MKIDWGNKIVATIKRKKKAEKPSFNKTELENMQLEFYRVKEQAKVLKKREDELKKRIATIMESYIKPDEKGHYTYSVLDENGKPIHLQRQARKSVTLNQDRAKEFLLENGYDEGVEKKFVIAQEVTQDQIIEVLEKHAPHLLDKAEVVNEDYLTQLVREGDIAIEDFEELCDIKINYSMTFIEDKKLKQQE